MAGALALAGCGGGGGGGGSVAVVSTAPTPAPSAAPITTPPPALVYLRYAELTGDQTFATACAALQFENSSPAPVAATNFGDGLTLSYAAGARAYTVTGDFLPTLTFGPADVDASAPAPTLAWSRVVDGFTTRLTLGTPTPGGTALDYARGLVVRAARPGSTIARQYQCVFGVPTLASDLPTSAISYARAAVNGTATVVDGSFAIRTYAISSSTVTASFDPVARRLTATIQLSGVLQTANGTSGGPVDLGTYSVNAPLDAGGRTSYYAATLPSADRNSQYSSLGGWFFGPKAREAGASFEIYATDAAGARISVLGNLIASQ